MLRWGLGSTEERRVSCLRRELLFRGDRETDRQTWRRRGEQEVGGKSIPRATCILTHSWGAAAVRATPGEGGIRTPTDPTGLKPMSSEP